MSTSVYSKVRYAVVGLGYFAQGAVLPAFAHARKNSTLAALVSADPKKHRRLGARYGVGIHSSYEDYDALLKSGQIDAVYIVLPNHLHADYAMRAARAGVHVLCEKPMALNERECAQMIETARQNNVKLMVAYRLHFEPANLAVVELVNRRVLGEPQFFSSVFGHEVAAGNIRAREDVGGGGLFDLGVYCINAARYLFRAEPVEVTAMTRNTDPARFKGVDEIASALLRFPGERLAQFTVSQSSAKVSEYRIVGTKGDLHMQPAYDYAQGLAYTLTTKGKTARKSFPKSDQVAPEIAYFSDCIQKNRKPEPSGEEGLADVRVVRALYRSAEQRRSIAIEPIRKTHRPSARQAITRPAIQKPELVNASSPSGH